MARIRRIMYASDFSPASRPAFTRAVDMAKINRAQLIVAHALAPVVPLIGDGVYMSPKTWDDIESAARATAQKELDRLVRAARKAGVRATSLLVDGLAAERIVRAVKAKRADMLVLGTHGRTGFTRALLGSVAARIVATASCPVLTVRGR
jgi:nucleotide-binding universal stress UspA family protein